MPSCRDKSPERVGRSSLTVSASFERADICQICGDGGGRIGDGTGSRASERAWAAVAAVANCDGKRNPKTDRQTDRERGGARSGRAHVGDRTTKTRTRISSHLLHVSFPAVSRALQMHKKSFQNSLSQNAPLHVTTFGYNSRMRSKEGP